MPSFGKLFHIRKPDDEKHPAGRTKVEAPATGHLHRTAVLDAKSTHSGAQAAVPSTPQMVGPNLSYSDHPPETTKNDGQVVGPAHAEAVLNEAAEKLEKAFPEDVQRKFQINPIHGSADISSLSQSIQDVLGQIMDKDQIEEKEQTLVKAVTNTWVKKAIPFVQKGLSVAKVSTFHTSFHS
jgi:hypothetical protein